jgi:hypothetical protein
VHAGVVPVLPARHAEAPIYHLDTAVSPEATRRAKAARYEAAEPGRPAYGGGPLNEVLYVPEDWPAARRRPVPPEDRAWIDGVLAAGTAPAEGGPSAPGAAARTNGAADVEAGGDVPLVPAAEIDAAAPARELPPDAYRVDLALLDPDDDRLAPGERRPLYVRVRNAGTATWPWGWDQDPQVRVSHHWRTSAGEMVAFEGERSPLPVRLPPGGSTVVPVWVTAPAEAGRYLLEIDLVHEHVRWFATPLGVAVTVADRPSRRSARTAPDPEAGAPC